MSKKKPENENLFRVEKDEFDFECDELELDFECDELDFFIEKKEDNDKKNLNYTPEYLYALKLFNTIIQLKHNAKKYIKNSLNIKENLFEEILDIVSCSQDPISEVETLFFGDKSRYKIFTEDKNFAIVFLSAVNRESGYDKTLPYKSYKHFHKTLGLSHQKIKSKLKKEGYLIDNFPKKEFIDNKLIDIELFVEDEVGVSGFYYKWDEDFIKGLFPETENIIKHSIVRSCSSCNKNFKNIFEELVFILQNNNQLSDYMDHKIQEFFYESYVLFSMKYGTNKNDTERFFKQINRFINKVSKIEKKKANDLKEAFDINYKYYKNYIEKGRGILCK